MVWFAVLGISWFWAMGTIVLAVFPTLARDVLHGSGSVVTLMLGVFAVGVGIGSLGVAGLVRDKALLHYVVACGFGVSLFTAGFALLAAHAPVLPNIPAMLVERLRAGRCWRICSLWRSAAAGFRCRFMCCCRNVPHPRTGRAWSAPIIS